ncbi:MAG TPA: ABC transporter [Clostridiales bacterium]|nr:ABC transporter [Clostridiales bacterium]
MKVFFVLTKRNIKLFFKDKGLFFSSLITPVILLVLYVTFLAKVYRNSLAQGITDSKLLEAAVGGELVSSFLAVCCVTIAFSSNLVMVQDKVNGAKKDILVTPVKKSIVSLAYYAGSLASTLTVGLIAVCAGFIYLAIVGWYLSFCDVIFILLDVILLGMFGTALSSIVNTFLSTQGQMSAVGTIVSAGYGFICGAYMPINSFSDGLKNIFAFFPGTYGTSLVRNHSLAGCFREMEKIGFERARIDALKENLDCRIKFFDNVVSIQAMFAVLVGSILLLIGIYVLINFLRKRKVK